MLSEVDSTPAVGKDGTVYFGSSDNNLYAVTPAGKLKWSFPTKGGITNSPVLGPDGIVYVGSRDGNLYKVTSADDGKLYAV